MIGALDQIDRLKGIDNLTIEETKALLLKFAFIIKIDKFEGMETKINMELEIYQKGDITFDEYNSILKKYGYNLIPEDMRHIFNR